MSETVRLIRSERRQLILEELAAAEQSRWSISELAERVAAAEYQCSPDTLTSDQRKRVYIALLQSHLPSLNESNVVLYDRDNSLVERGPGFGQVWQTYTAVVESLS